MRYVSSPFNDSMSSNWLWHGWLILLPPYRPLFSVFNFILSTTFMILFLKGPMPEEEFTFSILETLLKITGRNTLQVLPLAIILCLQDLCTVSHCKQSQKKSQSVWTQSHYLIRYNLSTFKFILDLSSARYITKLKLDNPLLEVGPCPRVRFNRQGDTAPDFMNLL